MVHARTQPGLLPYVHMAESQHVASPVGYAIIPVLTHLRRLGSTTLIYRPSTYIIV